MHHNMSDKEQIQMIKDWWKNNGTTIMVAILIFLIGNFGWRYWQNFSAQKSERASLTFTELLNAKVQNKTAEVRLYAKHLMQDFSGTYYADMAALSLAKEDVNVNNLNAAYDDLTWIFKHSHTNNIKQIARIHAAKILLAENKPKDALNMLAVIDDNAFLSLIDETKGDVLLAMGDKNAASAAYKDAKAAMAKDATVQSPLLKMKS